MSIHKPAMVTSATLALDGAINSICPTLSQVKILELNPLLLVLRAGNGSSDIAKSKLHQVRASGLVEAGRARTVNQKH